MKKMLYAVGLPLLVLYWFILPTQSSDQNEPPVLRAENGKLLMGGPIKDRLFQQRFYDADLRNCSNEEINIKISGGRAIYNFNTGDKVRTHRRQTKTEAYSDIQVGGEGCVIRIFISRPPSTEKCASDKCG